MKKTGIHWSTTLTLAAGMAVALALSAEAQTLRADGPGGFDYLVFDPVEASDWSAIGTEMDRAYGSLYEQFSDRASFNEARQSARNEVLRLDLADRSVVVAANQPVPEPLRAALMQRFAELDSGAFTEFSDGVTLAVIEYGDNDLVLALSLLRDTSPDAAAAGNQTVGLGGPPLRLAEGLEIDLPMDTEILFQDAQGGSGAPLILSTTAFIPLERVAVEAYLTKQLAGNGLSARYSETGDAGQISSLSPQQNITISIVDSEDPVGTVISSVGISY